MLSPSEEGRIAPVKLLVVLRIYRMDLDRHEGCIQRAFIDIVGVRMVRTRVYERVTVLKGGGINGDGSPVRESDSASSRVKHDDPADAPTSAPTSGEDSGTANKSKHRTQINR